MIDWFLWGWSNIAFVGALAGLVMIYWFSPTKLLFPILTAILIASSAFAGGFGWGEKRYVDGRDSGAAVERSKWEKSFNKLKADMEAERIEATGEIEKIRTAFLKAQTEKEAAKNEAAVSNARVLAIINNQPVKSKTITCEKANEKIVVPGCPNPYALPVDTRLLRNLQRSRNQNGISQGSN